MIFGSLNEVMEGEKTMSQLISESYKKNSYSSYNKGNKQKSGRVARILQKLSNFGMSYSDDVLKNMQAVPADPVLQNQDMQMVQRMYQIPDLAWKGKPEEDKDFRSKSLQEKVQVLRRMAEQPEIEDIIDIMCNECIVYDSDNSYVCKPFIDNAVVQDLNENALNEIRSAVDTIFYKIYSIENLKKDAWNIFRRFLVDGVLAYEIVYDNLYNPKNIIGIVELNPMTLTRQVSSTGEISWVLFKGVMGQERTLLDSQIIYIKYSDDGVSSRQSYLERLIRPFNIYRIIEQAQVIWTVTQSSFKTMFTIPVGKMSKSQGLQTLNQEMCRYKEDISFNNDTGELKVNGKVNLPFNKEYWLPENINGKPQIETLTDSGPSLNDSDQMKFFLSKLYKMSKIPESRFDKDVGATWFGTDATQALRDEINFGRFVARLRATFSTLLIKPIQIQLALQMPDLKNDKRILDAISLDFITYNQFTELMEAEIDQKRMEHIQTMKDTFTSTDADGNEIPYFCDKFLIIKYMKMSDADLALNEKYKLEMKKEEKANDEENSEDNSLDITGDENSGEENAEEDNAESDNDSAGEIDSEMMGDVQPENNGDENGEGGSGLDM